MSVRSQLFLLLVGVVALMVLLEPALAKPIKDCNSAEKCFEKDCKNDAECAADCLDDVGHHYYRFTADACENVFGSDDEDGWYTCMKNIVKTVFC